VPRHVIVDPDVVASVGEQELSRTAIVQLYTRLRDDLGNRTGRYQTNRHPRQPDFYFLYNVTVMSGGLWHRFDFAVGDTTAPDTLFVDAVEHTSWSV